MELKTYISIIGRRKGIIFIFASLFIILTIFGSNLIPNKYLATTRLRILTPKSGGANYVDFNIYYASRLMNTYASLASSNAMTQDIKNKLQLTEDPNISVSVIAESELIKITSEEQDPTLSAVIANTVAEMLLAQSNASSVDVKSSAEKAINDRLAQLNKELDTARKVYRVLIIPYNKEKNQIDALNNQILNDQQLYISLKTIYEQNIQLTHRDEVAMTALRTQISDLEKQITANQEKVDQLNQLVDQDSIQVASAQGDITLKEQEYTTLIAQFDQIQALGIIQGNNQLTIEEKAVIPKKPSSPNRALIIAIGTILSAFFSIIVAFIVDNVDDSLHNIQQIEMPLNGTDFGKVYIAGNPIQLMLNRFRQGDMLASNQAFRRIHRQIHKLKYKTIAFCGTEPGRGTLDLITRLSTEYANSGCKVLLLDANISGTNLNDFFPEIENKGGLCEYLNGELTVEEILTSTDIDNFFIIQTGSKKYSDGLLLSSKKMLVLLRTLKTEYDLIFVVLPPFASDSDIDSLVNHVDGVIVVLNQGQSKLKNINYVTQQLLEINAPLMGYITTHS
jgi:uncharacterized protein involved in exopolysaccharide biosynthesis